MMALGQTDGDNRMFGVPVLSRAIFGTDSLKPVAGRSIVFVPGDNNQDLDRDGLAEIIAPDYNDGGRVHVFEQVAKNSLRFQEVWASKKLKPRYTGVISAGPGSTPRTAEVADLDGDGRKEIIFPIGYAPTDTMTTDTTWARGLYVYQWDGVVGSNNYGTEPTAVIRPEDFDPDTRNFGFGRNDKGALMALDVDGDGKQELLVGQGWTFIFNKDIHKNSGVAWILQVQSGMFAQGNAKVGLEYKYWKMAITKEDSSDGYIPVGFQVADVDGDGKKEIIVFARVNVGTGAAVGFIKTTGPNTYTDGGIVDITDPLGENAFRVNASSATYRPQGQTADVVFFNTDEATADYRRVIAIQGVVDVNLVGINNFAVLKTGIGLFSGTAVGDQDHGPGRDAFDLYIPDVTRVWDMEYKGSGDIFDSTSYTLYKIFDVLDVYKRANGGLYHIIIPPSDINGNGRKEILTNWQIYGPDTVVMGNVPLNAGIAPFWVIEWGDTTKPTVSVQPLEIIYADDYTLEQNYPNPFNPGTNIRFSLPIDNEISLVIYDINGREVKRLINNERYHAGRYEVTWNGTNNFGQSVASGTYIYELRYGNFTKSMKMTLLK